MKLSKLKNIVIILIVGTLLSSSAIFSQVPAFPEAEGGGAISLGGHGGKIIEVTN